MKDDQSEILHRLDLDRRNRLGMIEAVWGEHKTAEQIIAIAIEMQDAGELMLATRINQSKAAEIALKIPNIKYYPQARCLSLGKLPETGIDGFGDVATFNLPFSVATTAAGTVVVGESGNSVIRKIVSLQVIQESPLPITGTTDVAVDLAITGLPSTSSAAAAMSSIAPER
jgi:NCAIR mutase (PurE)-related protein